MGKFENFIEQYRSLFAYEYGKKKRIGIEKEILTVDKNGMMADIPSKVWPHLLKAGYKPIYDNCYTDSIIGFWADGDQITQDAGRGTFEIIMLPHDTVMAAEMRMKELLKIIHGVCSLEGIRILALAYQPRTLPARENWNRKQRYDVLLDNYGEAVWPASLSASDQVHVDVAEKELVQVINTMNGMAGFYISLFANCPVVSGPSDYKAYREVIWDYLGAERTGLPDRPVGSLEEYLSRTWNIKCIMAFNGEKYFIPGVKFCDYAEKLKSEDEVFKAYAVHEGSIWFCARPRVYGTIEMRPAGLQPWEDMVSVSALTLGLMENLPQSEMFIKQFRWDSLRGLRMDAVKNGFEARVSGEKVGRFIREMLDLSKKGLEKRALGEEKYLDSLFRRVEEEKAPADKGREDMESGGVDFLMEKSSLKEEHLKF